MDGSAAQEPAPRPGANASRDLFWNAPARGAHEVVINAPDPVISLSDLPVEQVARAVEVWRERMRAHPEATYVHLMPSAHDRMREAIDAAREQDHGPATAQGGVR